MDLCSRDFLNQNLRILALLYSGTALAIFICVSLMYLVPVLLLTSEVFSIIELKTLDYFL